MNRASSNLLSGVVLVAIVALSVACASKGSSARGEASGCALRPADSVFAAAGPVYRDCAVDRRTRLATVQVEPDFVSPDPVACHTAEIEFVVGADGVPETTAARIIRSTHDSYTAALLKAIPQWRYEPALIGGTPVRQIVRVEHKLAFAGRLPFVVTRIDPGAPPAAGSISRQLPATRC